MNVWDGGEIEERFSLLLLEDGEYHFRDHNCQLLEPGGTRYASQLCLSAQLSSLDSVSNFGQCGGGTLRPLCILHSPCAARRGWSCCSSMYLWARAYSWP